MYIDDPIRRWVPGDRVTRLAYLDDGTWSRDGDECLAYSPHRIGTVVRRMTSSDEVEVKFDDDGEIAFFLDHGLEPAIPPHRTSLRRPTRHRDLALSKMQLQLCCRDYCRDWHEMAGGLPPSNHAPNCPNYKLEPFFKVTVKGQKGPWCCFATHAQVKDFCGEAPDEEYTVETIMMTRDQYEHLDEFEGF